MLYKIIFTKGHLDDLESLEKGVTGDILISNEEDVYFNPQYITIERVNYEFGIDKECYLEENLVLMHQITQETILKSIPHLHKWMFFEYWRPISDEILRKYFYPKEDWFIFKMEIE
ncbi:MAG: hypothetical protein PW786_06335 [Arachidicoccus sp.]|nr:hypothetical protein [Arachidicoccus sp.]